jgi:hypothetical protein
MSRSLDGSALSFVALCVLVQCAPAETVASAGAAHTDGNMLPINAPYAFVETEYSELPDAASVTLPADHKISVRLQLWLDRFHEIVKSDVEARTGHEAAAPRPIIKVVPNTSAKAWVTPVAGCVGGPVDLSSLAPAPIIGPPAGRPPTSAPAPVVVPSKGTMELMFQCSTAKNWGPSGALDWYASLGRACTFDRRPDGIAASGDDCTRPARHERADQLALVGGSPFIQLTTRMLALLDDERAAAAILAHELGHYYLAHGTNLGTFDYWYRQEARPRAGKPEPIEDSAEYEKIFQKHRSSLRTVGIEGERFSARLRGFELALASALGSSAGFDSSCAPLQAAATAPWRVALDRNAGLSDDDRRAFLDFQSRLLRCAATVRVSSGVEPGTLELQGLVRLLRSSPDIATPPPPAGPLSLILEILDGRARALDAESDAFRAELNRRHLGRYTNEQEADDFSMELLASAGLDPKDHLEAWLGFTTAIHDDPALSSLFAADGIPFDECVALYRAGWWRVREDAEREYVYAPLGNLSDSHHGFCYRLFNLSRERDAHGFVPHGSGPVSSVPWSEIVAAARAADVSPTLGPPPPVGGTTGTAIVDSY